MNDDALKRTIHRITDKRIDLRVPRGVTEPLRGTVTEVDPSTRRAMVRFGPGTRPVPVPYPALPVSLEANDEVVVQRGRDGWLMLTDVLGRDAIGTNSPWIDIRDFKAKGGGADDTAAILDAVAYASRIDGEDRQRIGSSATDFTLTIPGHGTTGTLASGASDGTIQAALEALVGIGNVKVDTFDGARVATFAQRLGNMPDMYSSLATGGTGPIIYPLSKSQAIGGDIWCPGLHGVSSTIEVGQANIRIWTGRETPGLLPGSGVSALRSVYSSGLIWVGEDDGGPILRFKASGQLGITGAGFAGSLIAGPYPYTTAAAVGIELVSVTHSDFPLISAVEFRDVGILIHTSDLTDGGYFPRNPAYNHFGFISTRHWVNPGHGIEFRGDTEEPPDGPTANAYLNRVDSIQCFYNVGCGLVLGNCDDNTFGTVRAQAYPSPGVTLATSAAADDTLDTATAHGLRVGDPVRFLALTGGSGLSVATTSAPRHYWVRTVPTTTSLTISALPDLSTQQGWTTDITAGTIARGGYGAWLRATEFSEGTPRLNYFDGLTSTGDGWFYSEGTENGMDYPAKWNTLLKFLDDFDGPGTPVIGTGSSLTWKDPRDYPIDIMIGSAFEA